MTCSTRTQSEALASQYRRWSLPRPAVIVASTVRPLPETVLSPVVARLMMSTRLMPTPAPTPTLASEAESPLPMALASVLALVRKVTRPPPLTVTPVAKKASDRVLMTLMLTAPATLSDAPLPSLSAALGVEDDPESLPAALLSFWLLFALVRLSSDFLLTSSPSLGAPLAAASASDVLAELPRAWKLTPVLADRLRAVEASAMSVTIASASEMPTPAVLPTVVSPLAVVVTVAVWTALASTLPLTVVVPVAAPRVALVVTLAREIATDGTMVTEPPDAPPSVSVVNVLTSVEDRVRLTAPVTGGPRAGSEPASMPDRTSSLTRLRATEAPTPTVAVPSLLALEVLLLLDEPLEVRTRSPNSNTPIGPSGSGSGVCGACSIATVVRLTMFSENAPAAPMVPLAPLAPAVADEEKVSVVSAGPLSGVIPAVKLTFPWPLMKPLAPRLASVRPVMRLMAAATPIVADAPLEAEPSAIAMASTLSKAVKLTSPDPADRCTPSPSSAVEDALTRLTAIAAATVTDVPPLSPVLAAGVLLCLVALPPVLVEVLLPRASWSSAFWLTFLPEPSEPEPFSPLAPAALAVASLRVEEAPSASKVTAPPVVVSRCSELSTSWSAETRASEAPIARVAPEPARVAPSALLDPVARWTALLSSLPVVVSALPAPTLAEVLTLLTVMATTAVKTAVLPPEAPPFAAVVALSVPVARSVRSWTPLRSLASSRPARTSSVTTLTATDAPTPTVPPLVLASAVTSLVRLLPAVSERSPCTWTPAARTSANA